MDPQSKDDSLKHRVDPDRQVFLGSGPAGTGLGVTAVHGDALVARHRESSRRQRSGLDVEGWAWAIPRAT